MRHNVCHYICRLVPQRTTSLYTTRYQCPISSPIMTGRSNIHLIYQHTKESKASRRLMSTTSSTTIPALRRPLSTMTTSLVRDNIISSPIPDLDIPTNITFHQFIFEKCDQFKDSLAVDDFLTGKQYTYRQLKEKSMRVASGLHKMGYRKGDVLLVISPNTVDIPVLSLACAATGLWLSPANPSFNARELATQLNHCGAIVVVAASGLVATVKEALIDPQFPNKVKDLFVFGEAPGFQPFQSLLDDDGRSFPDVDINPIEDIYALPYSSGTTGLPKGVMLTHYNCVANCMQVFASAPVSTEDVCVGLLPLYHIYGKIVLQFSVLLGGAQISFLPKFEPEVFLKCLQDRKVTLAHLVPPLMVFLAKHPLVSKYDLTSLRRIICGAAPLGPDITNEFLQRFHHKVQVNQGYGMTELSPVSNIDFTCTAGGTGHMVANTKGKIVDTETNKTLEIGEVGQFCVKGPQVMKGYYMNQKATDDMISPDGWLQTGDIGCFNKDGMLFIQDRLKELIKYKGSQVAPAEIEALLLVHPDVQDAAVIGVPDEIAGELPKAFIVRKPESSVTEEEIVKYIEGKVSQTKRLRGGVQFVNEIPKNPSGKILRRILRSKYL